MTYVIVIFLVFLSALFSGLTLGFFTLNRDDLLRKVKLGEKKAKKVYKLRKDGNLLLCTLLIGNVAVNSTLSIYLGSIASGFLAGIVATSLIVIFGEIIPQATFSRYALKLGAKLAWLVSFFIFIFYPISKPLAWMLDKILGDEIPTIYTRHELIKLIEDHEDSRHSDIDTDEEKIIKGALSYSNKKVHEILTPRTEIFALEYNEPMNKNTKKRIYESGHSRIPIYIEEIDKISGMLYSKDLVNNDVKGRKAGEMARDDVIFVDYNKPLDDLLQAFRQTRHHLFVVLNEYGGVAGIVTIEDVLEEIIGAEIVDEFDKYEDLQKEAKKKLEKKKITKV